MSRGHCRQVLSSLLARRAMRGPSDVHSLQLMPMHAQPCWSCCQSAKSGNAAELHGTLCFLRACLTNAAK